MKVLVAEHLAFAIAAPEAADAGAAVPMAALRVRRPATANVAILRLRVGMGLWVDDVIVFLYLRWWDWV
jgi:hypothetical protein